MKGETAIDIKSPVNEPLKNTEALGNSLGPLIYSLEFYIPQTWHLPYCERGNKGKKKGSVN
jgi:hypothetical protein